MIQTGRILFFSIGFPMVFPPVFRPVFLGGLRRCLRIFDSKRLGTPCGPPAIGNWWRKILRPIGCNRNAFTVGAVVKSVETPAETPERKTGKNTGGKKPEVYRGVLGIDKKSSPDRAIPRTFVDVFKIVADGKRHSPIRNEAFDCQGFGSSGNPEAIAPSRRKLGLATAIFQRSIVAWDTPTPSQSTTKRKKKIHKSWRKMTRLRELLPLFAVLLRQHLVKMHQRGWP